MTTANAAPPAQFQLDSLPDIFWALTSPKTWRYSLARPFLRSAPGSNGTVADWICATDARACVRMPASRLSPAALATANVTRAGDGRFPDVPGQFDLWNVQSDAGLIPLPDVLLPAGLLCPACQGYGVRRVVACKDCDGLGCRACRFMGYAENDDPPPPCETCEYGRLLFSIPKLVRLVPDVPGLTISNLYIYLLRRCGISEVYRTSASGKPNPNPSRIGKDDAPPVYFRGERSGFEGLVMPMKEGEPTP